MKKNLFAKTLAVILSLTLSGSILASCTPFTDKSTDVIKSEIDEVGDIIKPKSIRIMATTIISPENGSKYIEEEYERRTGIKLILEKPSYCSYYEPLSIAIAANNSPDAFEIGSTYYPQFANDGVLWDMSQAWNESTEPVKSIVNEAYVDALQIDGKLYGFPMSRGNGVISYARGDWMDELNIGNPTNFDEYLDMLRKFKQKDSRIIPLTAAGLINSEEPYDIYLREFYQDAVPNIYKNNSGIFVNGFTEPAMKDALARMRMAYKEGLIDREAITNKTSTCRDKLYEGRVGVFNYWAGSWNQSLEDNLQIGSPDAYLRPLFPIEEAKYIERSPIAIAISSKCKNPLGVFNYLILYSHDGGEGQMLFTRGVEGIHWDNINGTTVALPTIEDSNKLVEKSFFAPELSITNYDEPIDIDERIINSLDIFTKNSTIVDIPLVNRSIQRDIDTVNTIRDEVIVNVVLGNQTLDEGMNEFEKRAGEQVQQVLDILNKTE